MKRLYQMDHLVNELGLQEAIEAIVRACSDDDFNKIYKYICRSYDLKAEEPNN